MGGKINVIEKISEIFDIFHDAGIEAWEGNEDKLMLTIGCTYLAELINPDFDFFYLEIDEIENLQMDCWTPQGTAKKMLKSFDAIFNASLEVSSSEVKDGRVFVYFRQGDDDLDYVGGALSFIASGATIFQHDKKEISLELLSSICRDYWNSKKKQNL